MNAYQVCNSGNCDPYSCPVCANLCDACGEWLTQCVCPTLPLDEDAACCASGSCEVCRPGRGGWSQ